MYKTRQSRDKTVQINFWTLQQKQYSCPQDGWAATQCQLLAPAKVPSSVQLEHAPSQIRPRGHDHRGDRIGCPSHGDSSVYSVSEGLLCAANQSSVLCPTASPNCSLLALYLSSHFVYTCTCTLLYLPDEDPSRDRNVALYVDEVCADKDC